ncbi:MAG TPA: hypothetical protein PKE55_10375 [Kiritimatiellia bacterium]|nr:hypothetical protein [Kiritimatiellia bacterium]
MTMWQRAIGVAMVGVIPVMGWAETFAERLLEAYQAVETVSCELRKDIRTPEGRGRRLSRIYYQFPDRLHVDNAAPLKRRILADGETLSSYIEGDPKGFRRPIDRLEEDWLISLRNVPGSPMEHLFKLRGVPEEVLEPTDRHPRRLGYAAPTVYVVLELDEMGRIEVISFYPTPAMLTKRAEYRYSGFVEAGEGIWLATRHDATLWTEGGRVEETTRISNLAVNEPIAASLFIKEPFFKGIDFTDDLAEIYGR